VPKGRLIVNYVASHPDFTGIGEGKANALYDAFGNDLISLLDTGDVEALRTVLTAYLAERLVEAWSEKRAEGAVIAYLDKYGFDLRLSNKLRRVWGSQALEMLELNPNRVAGSISLVCDFAADLGGHGSVFEQHACGKVDIEPGHRRCMNNR
jgi:exodeoxyribonuclease V alpha subunit